MSWLKKQLLKLSIAYVKDYARKEWRMKSKKGFFTSEFIIAMVAAIIPVLNTQLGWNIPSEQVISILTVLLGYIFNRMRLKEKSRV